MASRGKFRNQGNNANKGGNSKSPKKTGKPAQSREANENDYEAVCDEIIKSLDTDDQPPALKSLAKELSAIILPAIAQVIESSIESKAVSKAEFETLKASVRLNKYETDRLEQYTRRENIRIFNLVQQDQKPLVTLVLQLLNDMAEAEGVTQRFSEADISVCHRVGKPPATGNPDNRAVIVRFLSRQSVMTVFKCKNKLKNMGKYKSVFISEDITQLRVKLRELVKSTEGVSGVYTRDGNIHCTRDGQHHVIGNTDDLFKLGVEPDMEALGLREFA